MTVVLPRGASVSLMGERSSGPEVPAGGPRTAGSGCSARRRAGQTCPGGRGCAAAAQQMLQGRAAALPVFQHPGSLVKPPGIFLDRAPARPSVTPVTPSVAWLPHTPLPQPSQDTSDSYPCFPSVIFAWWCMSHPLSLLAWLTLYLSFKAA